jgi:hypothetical protein
MILAYIRHTARMGRVISSVACLTVRIFPHYITKSIKKKKKEHI